MILRLAGIYFESHLIIVGPLKVVDGFDMLGLPVSHSATSTTGSCRRLPQHRGGVAGWGGWGCDDHNVLDGLIVVLEAVDAEAAVVLADSDLGHLVLKPSSTCCGGGGAAAAPVATVAAEVAATTAAAAPTTTAATSTATSKTAATTKGMLAVLCRNTIQRCNEVIYLIHYVNIIVRIIRAMHFLVQYYHYAIHN